MEIPFSIGNETIMLTADTMNYTLCRMRKRKNKDGVTTDSWEPWKYFSCLPSALDKVIDLKVRTSSARDLKQLRVDLETAKQEVMQVWRTALHDDAEVLLPAIST